MSRTILEYLWRTPLCVLTYLVGTATMIPLLSVPAVGADGERAAAADLTGYWPLNGDCRDRSGNDLHGVNHGVRLEDATFDGKSSYIEIPASPKLQLGTGDFTVAAWVRTEQNIDDLIGDVLSQYDASRRRGFSLTIKSTAGGYSSHGDDRHVYFGIDNGREPTWEDCGRPSPTSNYVSNSLTVFDGQLYAAITDAEKFEDWCHVFRYAGEQKWDDCGRVGDRRTHGVGPMVVHRGSLYAATWTYDWNRVGIRQPLDDFCCVYRYAGGAKWEDCGQPGQCRRLFGLASFRGGLYVTAEDGRCYVHAGDRNWRECGRFPNYAHPLGIHDGKLYAGVLNPAGVWAFDGERWQPLGNPQGSEDRCDQVHALEVYRGRLHVTTWPEGHVVRLEPDGRWTDCGRLGDALEINALNVYNGQLYGGAIPRAEVFRYNPAAVRPLSFPMPPPQPKPTPTRRPVRPAARSRRLGTTAVGLDLNPPVSRSGWLRIPNSQRMGASDQPDDLPRQAVRQPGQLHQFATRRPLRFPWPGVRHASRPHRLLRPRPRPRLEAPDRHPPGRPAGTVRRRPTRRDLDSIHLGRLRPDQRLPTTNRLRRSRLLLRPAPRSAAVPASIGASEISDLAAEKPPGV